MQPSEKLSRYNTVTQGSSEAVSRLRSICAHDTLSGPGYPAEQQHFDVNLQQHVHHARHEGARKDNAGAGLPSRKHPHHHGLATMATPVTAAKTRLKRGLSASDAREEAKLALMRCAKQIHVADKKQKEKYDAWRAFSPKGKFDPPPADQEPEDGPDAIRRSGSIVNDYNRTEYQRFLRD